MYFYLTSNIAKDEPAAIKAVPYIHVKAKADGSQTVCLSEQAVSDPNVSPMTREAADAILKAWIDDENASPVVDIDGNQLIQSYIDIGAYL